MDISVIVPCYNGAELIGPLIDSINRQTTNLNVEVIFGLDNCSDNTEQVIRENLKYVDYKIIECHNGDTGSTRNDCLEQATGKYIMFADQDDWFLETDVFDVLYNSISQGYDIVEFKIRTHEKPMPHYGVAAVWRAIYTRSIIGETRFPSGYGEDNSFSEEVWQKCGFEHGGWGGMPTYVKNQRWLKIDYTPYFWNYPRKGSRMDLKYDSYNRWKRGEEV